MYAYQNVINVILLDKLIYKLFRNNAYKYNLKPFYTNYLKSIPSNFRIGIQLSNKLMIKYTIHRAIH